ncbi:IclR family transcriptional regulator [Plantactinospora alkalitolerans]|uniref:IclR family transcriptional regulator n=1 Tax=Plantactinospora alkalitolerans TaxID=2789879 RepID=UPI002B1F375F|nr:IclR family transcriptional regulator [Plantactinospora alkalitolerans]
MRTAERNIPDLAVARVSAVLGAFDSRHRELRVSEISRRTGLPKSTTSRLVADLVTYGFLDRTGTSLRIGVRLFEFGELASGRRDLRAIALPYLTDLREATGQDVHLAVLAGTDVVYVEILRGRDGPRLPSEVGGRLPAHACAVGKALLAFAVEAAVSLVCNQPLRTVGPRTVTAPALLRQQLARIRESGLAYDNEESGLGVASVASAVLHADGRPVAAVSVSGRTGGLSLRSVGPAVRTVALSIGREL